MNFLYLIDPGSIHDQKWIEPFCNEENNVFVISRNAKLADVQNLQDKFGIKFITNVGYFSIRSIVKSIQSAFEIRRSIKKNKIQVFHIQYAEPNVLWTLFRRFFNIPIVVTCRGTDVLKTIPDHFSNKNLINSIVKRLYKKSFEWADVITVTSSSQQKSVLSFSSPKNKIEVIRTGVDLNILNSNKCEQPIRNLSEKYILFPRYIKPIYNHEFTINSLSLLPKKIKLDYQMVFVGKGAGDSKYQNEIEQLMQSYPDLQFLFLPKQSQADIHCLMYHSSLVVMNPLSDGSPVSAMEAIALGKKVVLGPIQYDEEVFRESLVLKLAGWVEAELAEKITSIISDTNKFDSELDNSIKDLIDREANINKLKLVYSSLI